MKIVGVFAALMTGALGPGAVNCAATALQGSTPAQHLYCVHVLTRAQFPLATRLAGTAKQEPAPAQTSRAKCAEAVVNPVTGHAECMRPRGAAVDPPPQSAVPCTTHTPGEQKRGCPSKQPE
jgi:hypothetical protein